MAGQINPANRPTAATSPVMSKAAEPVGNPIAPGARDLLDAGAQLQALGLPALTGRGPRAAEPDPMLAFNPNAPSLGLSTGGYKPIEGAFSDAALGASVKDAFRANAPKFELPADVTSQARGGVQFTMPEAAMLKAEPAPGPNAGPAFNPNAPSLGLNVGSYKPTEGAFNDAALAVPMRNAFGPDAPRYELPADVAKAAAGGVPFNMPGDAREMTLEQRRRAALLDPNVDSLEGTRRVRLVLADDIAARGGDLQKYAAEQGFMRAMGIKDLEAYSKTLGVTPDQTDTALRAVSQQAVQGAGSGTLPYQSGNQQVPGINGEPDPNRLAAVAYSSTADLNVPADMVNFYAATNRDAMGLGAPKPGATVNLPMLTEEEAEKLLTSYGGQAFVTPPAGFNFYNQR